jgi:hypothetical protein
MQQQTETSGITWMKAGIGKLEEISERLEEGKRSVCLWE